MPVVVSVLEGVLVVDVGATVVSGAVDTVFVAEVGSFLVLVVVGVLEGVLVVVVFSTVVSGFVDVIDVGSVVVVGIEDGVIEAEADIC